MCGIAGWTSFFRGESAHKPDVVKKVLDAQSHRGPEFRGSWEADGIVLLHNRLSIIDLSEAANQPMHLESAGLTVVFNGEIYNFRELRSELMAKGSKFRTFSDTEVLLHGFAKWGTGLFARLNGVFAIALWDNSDKSLYLVRDRIGVKPIYYALEEGDLLFSSEIKGIRKAGSFFKINHQAFSEFLFYGNSCGDLSLFEGIRHLKPGHFLKYNQGKCVEHTYWKIENIFPFQGSLEEATERLAFHLETAVRRQLVSDVPIGVFLSGGIDSSAVTAFAAKHYEGPIDTYSVKFDFSSTNELPKARIVAEKYRTNHHEFSVGVNDLESTIIKMIDHHDEPFGDAANIPLYMISKRISKAVKVVLQGDGGDELFAGYNRYPILQKLWRHRALIKYLYGDYLSRLTGPRIGRVSRILEIFSSSTDANLFGSLLTVERLSRHPYQILDEDIAEDLYANADPFLEYARQNRRFEYIANPVDRMLYIDSQIILPNTFLEKVDRATMANSVEARVPFLDFDLFDFALSLPSGYKLWNGNTKGILKRSLKNVLPEQIINQKKMGFGVPYGEWLKGPLRPLFYDALRTCPLVNVARVEQKFEEHSKGIYDHSFLLWKVLMISIWYNRQIGVSYNG